MFRAISRVVAVALALLRSSLPHSRSISPVLMDIRMALCRPSLFLFLLRIRGEIVGLGGLGGAMAPRSVGIYLVLTVGGVWSETIPD